MVNDGDDADSDDDGGGDGGAKSSISAGGCDYRISGNICS